MAQIYPLKNLPNSIETLLRASVTSFKKPGNGVPDKGYSYEGVSVDKKQYASYCKMFGFSGENVPSPYWYIRLFSLKSLLMAHPDAPFPMPGMVHLIDEIHQYDAISPNDSLDVTCQFGRLISHDKGTILEIITQLRREEKIVWEEKNYNLYMGKKDIGQPADPSPAIDISAPDQTYEWSLPSGLGLEYAKMSGDFNPIHLHDVGAKLLGFPKHLIHGWYSLNRAVAPIQSSLENAHELYVAFKKPLFLPGKVVSRTQTQGNSILFDVINEKEGFPHLKGFVKKK